MNKILQDTFVAEALWAYRNSIMEEAKVEYRWELFLSGTGINFNLENFEQIERDHKAAMDNVKSAYDALEEVLQKQRNGL